MGTSRQFACTSWRSELTVDLLRLIQLQKEQPQTTPVVQTNGNAKSSKQKPPKPQPSQQQQQQNIQAQPPQQQQQPAQAQQLPQQKRSRSRSRNNKREDGTSSRRQSGSNAAGAAAPTMILQRSPKGKSPPPGLAQEVNGSTVPMSKADGIAAGEAILGMISQPLAEQQSAPQQDKKQRKQQTAELLVPTAVQPQTSSAISKEQLKQTLISLLDDTQFFDQIYHAYVDRVLKRAA